MNKEFEIIKTTVAKILADYNCWARYFYVDGRGVEIIIVDSKGAKNLFSIDGWEVMREEPPYFNSDTFLINIVQKYLPRYLEDKLLKVKGK